MRKSASPLPPPDLTQTAAGLTAPALASALAGLAAMQLVRQAGMPGDATLWLVASVAFALCAARILRLMRHSYPHARFGSCNVVTLLRLALVWALVPSLMGNAGAGWLVAVVAATALALDGVDGRLARRSGLTSCFGARFDMEVDAALALVLALHAFYGAQLGAWVLLLGSMRYGFVIAGWVWPWLRAELTQRFRRKLICVVQLAALIVLQLPMLRPDQASMIAGAATAALLWSFAIDIYALWRERD